MSPLLSPIAPATLADLAKHQLLLRDLSSSSTSSLSLSSTPTLVSSSSRTLSSSGFDTPAQSPDEEDPFRASEYHLYAKEHKLGYLSYASPSSPQVRDVMDGDADIEDRGYESEIEDSFGPDRTRARRKSSNATIRPTRRKAGLPYRRPNTLVSAVLGYEPPRMASIPSTASSSPSSREHTPLNSSEDMPTTLTLSVEPSLDKRHPPPSSIDITKLVPPIFHHHGALGLTGLDYPAPRFRAASSPMALSSPPASPLSKPPAAPILHGTGVPFLTPTSEPSATLFPSRHASFALPRSPPRERFFSPKDLPQLSPPLFPPPSPLSLDHHSGCMTSPTSPSSRFNHCRIRPSPIRKESNPSRITMRGHQLSLSRSPRRPKSPPIPPALVGSPRLDGLIGSKPSTRKTKPCVSKDEIRSVSCFASSSSANSPLLEGRNLSAQFLGLSLLPLPIPELSSLPTRAPSFSNESLAFLALAAHENGGENPSNPQYGHSAQRSRSPGSPLESRRRVLTARPALVRDDAKIELHVWDRRVASLGVGTDIGFESK